MDYSHDTPATVLTSIPALTPILDALAARYRLGESEWTFDHSNQGQLASLSRLGLITYRWDVDGLHIIARLTEHGYNVAFNHDYVPPIADLHQASPSGNCQSCTNEPFPCPTRKTIMGSILIETKE